VRLVIPDAVWSNLLDEFARQKPGDERIAYLDGFSGDDVGVVTTLTLPDAECTPGYYTVSAEQMKEAGAHFRTYSMRRLAQVHTHGGRDTTPSCQDERLAYSQRPGAISIVLPDHAVHRPSPVSGSVNKRTVEGWKRLSAEEAEAAICLVPSVLDFRRSIWSASHPDTTGISAGVFTRAARLLRSLFRWRSRHT
jgi:hypothetical protein